MYKAPSELVSASIRNAGIPSLLFYTIFSLGYTLVTLTAFYGFYFLVGPALFVQKKVLKTILMSVIVLASMVLVRYLVEYQLLIPFLKFHNYFGNTPGWYWYIQNCILFSYKACLLGLIAYFIAISQKIEKEKQEAEREKIRAELSFLRSQVNPHFLFNTINDIYSLVYQKSDLAPDALLKLSGILRYMLDEGNRDQVPLQKELTYLEDYIALQRIGLKDQLQLEVQTSGLPGSLQIASLLLIPFVENIFKHGMLTDPQHPAKLRIEIEGTMLKLEAANAVRLQQKDAVKGIGLHNVERRLQLLYPGKHTFERKDEDGYFYCSLTLQLTNGSDKPNHPA
jgi:LytS/YehU family sensor histidine kinase